jgi:hypothetical protein
MYKLYAESQEEKNPFLRDISAFSVNSPDGSSSRNLFLDILKKIPKVGEKNAEALASIYKSKREQRLFNKKAL